MGLQKGQTNNLNGRPKGSTNKRTQQWEKFAEWFMTDGMDRLQEEMGKLDGKEFVREVKDLMEYFQPKLSRSEVKNEIEVIDSVDLSQFETKDLKKAIESDKRTDTD